jgi:hypothetical protein
MRIKTTFLAVTAVVLAGLITSAPAAVDMRVFLGRDGDSGVEIDPDTGAYLRQTRNLSGKLLASDLSFGTDGFGYAINGGTLYEVTDTLAATGREYTSGTSFTSVDVGPNGMIYVSRAGEKALEIDPSGASLSWTGKQSQYAGVDITLGSDGFFYQARSGAHALKLDANMQWTTGIQSSLDVDSIDWGYDGMLYAGRNGASALQLDPSTLGWTGKQTKFGSTNLIGEDISMGLDNRAWVVRGAEKPYEVVEGSSSLLFNTQSSMSGTFTSADVLVIPEPASLALLAVGGTLMLKRRRK